MSRATRLWQQANAAGVVAIGALLIVCAFVFFGAWLTHVVATIQSGEIVLLIAGAIFFPIGIVHGVMIWFGFV